MFKIACCQQACPKSLKNGRSYWRERFSGSVLAEVTAGMLLLFPTIILAIYVVVELSQAMAISQAMNEGAYLAARALAVYYKSDPEVVTTSSEQQTIFSSIRITNMINSNNQFTIPSGSSGWNTSGSPPTVTVVVKYLSGQGSPALPTFPYPDPLHLGSTFTISGTATAALVQ